jgi:hypothetical protein
MFHSTRRQYQNKLIDSYEKHFDGCDLSKTQRVQWNKTYSTIALAKSAMERIPYIALLGNGIFYSISRDHKQPIKRSEFNKVLYNN